MASLLLVRAQACLCTQPLLTPRVQATLWCAAKQCVLRGVCLRGVAATCRFLTDEGIEYLREYLNLPSEIVPATLKKSTRPLERNTG